MNRIPGLQELSPGISGEYLVSIAVLCSRSWLDVTCMAQLCYGMMAEVSWALLTYISFRLLTQYYSISLRYSNQRLESRACPTR